MRLGSQSGSTLIELIVGGAIALIALGLIIQMQISAYRYQQVDEDRFTVQTEAVNGLERISQDLRMASAVSDLTPGGSTLTLTVGGQTIRYSYRIASGEVVRTEGGVERVIGRRVESLAFYPEGTGGTVRIEWLARLPDGTTYLLVSRASPRVRPGG